MSYSQTVDDTTYTLPTNRETGWGTQVTNYLIALGNRAYNLGFDVKEYGAVGDGITNDTSAIQDALADAVSAGGGTVFFPYGTYLVTSSNIIIQGSNIRLTGAKGAKIKMADAPNTSSILIWVDDSSDGVLTDILIDNLSFDGNGDNWAGGSSNSQAHIIEAESVNRLTICNCYFYKSAGAFIRTEQNAGEEYCTDVTIANNYMEECRQNGITINANRASVVNNVINGFNTDGIVWEPDQADESRYIYIAGNKIIPNATKLTGGGSNRLYGISIKNSSTVADARGHVSVVGNTIEGVADSGTQYPQTGIYVNKCTGYSIANNLILETRIGVEVADATSPGSITGNHVKGCTNEGIKLYTDNVCSGNVVRLCGEAGIWVYRDNNIVTGNICKNNGTAAGSWPHGIYVDGDNCIFTNNRCYDNQGSPTQEYGLYLSANAQNTQVGVNYLSGNNTGDFFIATGGTLWQDVIVAKSVVQSVAGDGAVTIILCKGQNIHITLEADTTLTLSNPVVGARYFFHVVQDGTGGWNITWPAAVQWASEGAPSISGMALNERKNVCLYYDGTYYWGEYGNDFSAP